MSAKPHALQSQVSVVMASHNNGRFIREAIESVLNQTYTKWELIIIENASTDDSLRLARLAAHRDPRVQVIALTEKRSIAAVMNFGLEHAQGGYVAVLDSDDVWLPHRLARQVPLLEANGNPRIGVCGSNAILINERGEEIGTKRFPLAHEDCLRALWYRNPFCHSAVLMRKSLLRELGNYDENIEAAFDLELWLRLSASCRLCNLPESLVKYRLREASASTLWHRRMVQDTLRVRRLAVEKHGHRLTLLRGCGLGFTWMAQWAPPQLARAFFYRAVLPIANFLFRSGRSRSFFERTEESPSRLGLRAIAARDGE